MTAAISASSTATAAATAAAATAASAEVDKYLWLEDVEAEECLDFAKSANDKCLHSLGDPKSGPSYERILSVLESEDRIPHASSHGKDAEGNRVLFNFWKDKEHSKGIWRKTTLDEYRKEKPEWTTVLDGKKSVGVRCFQSCCKRGMLLMPFMPFFYTYSRCPG